MLAMKDSRGVVEASLPGLADLSRVTIPEAKEAIELLMSPDSYSRTKEHEGRRIAECEGGWLVVNHKKFRDMMSKDERREYMRVKQAEFRSRKNDVNSREQMSTLSTHTDTNTDRECREKDPKPPKKPKRIPNNTRELGPLNPRGCSLPVAP